MSLAASPFDQKGDANVLSSSLKPVGAPKSKFNQFSLDYSKLLSDDYVHKKFLTLKYNGKGQRFIFNGKGTLDFKAGSDKKEKPVTSSEVKFVTNVEGKNFEAKFDNKGLIRVWGNFGIYNLIKPVAVTAKVKTTNSFSNYSANLGVEYEGKQSNVQARIDLKNDTIPFFNSKLLFNDGKLQFGYAAKINLLAYTLARYNIYFGYRERDFTAFIEHTSRNKAKVEVGKLMFGGIYRTGGNDYVFKASYRPHKIEQLRFKLGAVANPNKDTVLRAKVNNNAKLTLSSKFKYNSNLSFVAGTQINLLDPSSFLTNKAIPIPLGISVEFNYS